MVQFDSLSQLILIDYIICRPPALKPHLILPPESLSLFGNKEAKDHNNLLSTEEVYVYIVLVTTISTQVKYKGLYDRCVPSLEIVNGLHQRLRKQEYM